MPAGLDGNPAPIVTASRSGVLAGVASAVSVLHSGQPRVLVGVDGRSGAGKSTFADELSSILAAQGIATLRSTTDSFHRSQADRMRRGECSGDGYYLDSHQLSRIVDELLDPFAQGASSVRIAAFDEPTDEPVLEEAAIVDEAVLIFDGLFLHRSEFREFWDQTVFLTADQRLDAAWLDFLLSDLPAHATDRAQLLDERLRRARWPRYRDGWRRYLDSGTVVVSRNANGELFEPLINDPFPNGVPAVISDAGFEILETRLTTETGFDGFAPITRSMQVDASGTGCDPGDLDCVMGVWSEQPWAANPDVDDRGVIRFEALTCSVSTRWIGGPDAGYTSFAEQNLSADSWRLSFTCPRNR